MIGSIYNIIHPIISFFRLFLKTKLGIKTFIRLHLNLLEKCKKTIDNILFNSFFSLLNKNKRLLTFIIFALVLTFCLH